MANSDIVIQNKLKPIVSVFNCAFLYISTPTFVSLLLQVQSTADQRHVCSQNIKFLYDIFTVKSKPIAICFYQLYSQEILMVFMIKKILYVKKDTKCHQIFS